MPNLGGFTPTVIFQSDVSSRMTLADVSNTAGVTTPGFVFYIPILLPNAATTTYTYTTTEKIEIVDMIVVKRNGAGTGNTVQVRDGSGNTITDAVAAAVDDALTRAATITDTGGRNVVAAGGTFQVVSTRAAGTSDARVLIGVMIVP